MTADQTGDQPATQEDSGHRITIRGSSDGSVLYGTQNGMAEIAATAVVTAAVLPFVQALAAQAGQRAFEAARSLATSLIKRTHQDHPRHFILAVQDEGRPITFEVPPGLPDAALQALAVTDVEELTAADPSGGQIKIHWNPETAQWQRIVG
ncbi:hypothetical protein [Streptomyces sedi]|uniref:Uncharacterized protein n=1 Tax=Streptomyces sedi TaxID=555059 RepID=A0A5C4UV63_9ACTN|nr:hypothetical protein [Streptomyces sedi]TNM27086.1 hypothetical protein FH715_22300 [Streptomyces sedi]